jgi:4-hydroxybenzoate polyprenyltransferase
MGLMNKIYLINFSLMEKIADKKNGITTEDATAFITGVEWFFVGLMVEFILMRLIPIKFDKFIVFGVMAVIWYYTHYMLRKSLGILIKERGIRALYKKLGSRTQKIYLALSIVMFFLIFFIFFIVGVLTIYNYDKTW